MFELWFFFVYPSLKQSEKQSAAAERAKFGTLLFFVYPSLKQSEKESAAAERAGPKCSGSLSWNKASGTIHLLSNIKNQIPLA